MNLADSQPSIAGRPKVLWLIDSLCMGGAEQLALDFAAHADAHGLQVELVALRKGDGLLAAACPQHLIGARNLRDTAGLQRLVRLLRQRHADLLHTHLRYAHIWGSLAARRAGIPCLSTLHVLPQPVNSPREHILAGLERLQLNHACARVIAVSQAQAAAWRAAGLRTPRLEVIPNGVALLPRLTPEERREEREHLGLPPDALIFLTVAVVRGLKGWRHLLRAVPGIRTIHPNARFVWVGGGPEFADLQREIAAGGLTGILHLPGRRSDVPRWLQVADVFLFPSEEEALPTALLEAMGAALPVVASRLPPVEEILRGHGRTIAPGDASALAHHALQLAASATLRRQEGDDLRRLIAERYSTQTWILRLTETYQEVLREHRASSPRAQAPARARPASSRPRLLAIERFSRGGLFHYTAQLTQALARQGAEVTLLTARHLEVSAAELAGVRLLDRLWSWNPHQPSRWLPHHVQRGLRGLTYVVGWLQILACVAHENPDIVLLGDFEHRCDAWFIAWLARRGWVLADIWHNVTSFDRSGGEGVVRVQPWRDRTARHFQTVFVHGETLARQFENATGCKAVVIPHGNQNWIACQAGPNPNLDRLLDLPPGRPVALLFGSLTRYKGIDLLIEALRLLPEERRPITVIAGFPLADCPMALLHMQADRSGVSSSLRWQIGYIPTPQVPWYFRRADFVVLPYRAASQSGVAHLALTFGKPLIVTATGSLPELIAAGANGLVIAPNDAAALAAALDQMTQDSTLRQRMGLAARYLADTLHNWDDIARQVLAALPLAAPPIRQTEPAQTGATP